MEALRLKMESWRVCKTVVADSQDFDEEQDPDQDPHQSDKSDPDPLQNVRIKVRKKGSGSATLVRNLKF
jgi:hypothetical protein